MAGLTRSTRKRPESACSVPAPTSCAGASLPHTIGRCHTRSPPGGRPGFSESPPLPAGSPSDSPAMSRRCHDRTLKEGATQRRARRPRGRTAPSGRGSASAAGRAARPLPALVKHCGTARGCGTRSRPGRHPLHAALSRVDSGGTCCRRHPHRRLRFD